MQEMEIGAGILHFAEEPQHFSKIWKKIIQHLRYQEKRKRAAAISSSVCAATIKQYRTIKLPQWKSLTTKHQISTHSRHVCVMASPQESISLMVLVRKKFPRQNRRSCMKTDKKPVIFRRGPFLETKVSCVRFSYARPISPKREKRIVTTITRR